MNSGVKDQCIYKSSKPKQNAFENCLLSSNYTNPTCIFGIPLA
jgi:hypothetical protein